MPFVTAALVLVGALNHIKPYFDEYRSVPNANLGRSFLLNGAAGTVLAIALVSIGSASRLRRLTRAASHRVGCRVARRVGDEQNLGVFEFTESGWNPSPETAIAVFAGAGALVLAVIALVMERSESDTEPLDERRAGDSVIWTNRDSFAHTTRTDDASFDSPNLAQGDNYSHTPSMPPGRSPTSAGSTTR